MGSLCGPTRLRAVVRGRCAALVAAGLLLTAFAAAAEESDRACDVDLRLALEDEEMCDDGSAAISLLQRRGVGHIVTSNVSASSFIVEAASVSQLGGVEVNASSAVHHRPPGKCEKLTGGTCLWDRCDESRAATCDHRSLCVCPEYTCSDGAGRCVLSAAEIKHAVKAGVYDVKEKVVELIHDLPGLADRITRRDGTVAHMLDAASAELDDLIGEGDCKTVVGTCVFSDCPKTVSLTADCNYGVCKCKPNFCYAQIQGSPMCVPDMSKLFGQP